MQLLLGGEHPSEFAGGFITEMLGTLITFVAIELTFIRTERIFEKEKLIYEREMKNKLTIFETLKAVIIDYLDTFYTKAEDLSNRLEQGKMDENAYKIELDEMNRRYEEMQEILNFKYEDLRMF